MIKRALFTLAFICIWLPCLLFTVTNASLAPPLPAQQGLDGPYDWRYSHKTIEWQSLPPQMLVFGEIQELRGDSEPIVMRRDFLGWLQAGKSGRRYRQGDALFATALPERPYVTQRDLQHDASLHYNVAGLRFNGWFLLGGFLLLLLPPLFILWMFADDVVIVTPQERKRRDDEFKALVQSIEAQAKLDPDWLGKKTIGLALLGYAVVLGSVVMMIPVGLGLGAAVLVIAGVNALAAKFAFFIAAVPIGFAYTMSKSLLTPRYEPQGIEISEHDAPKLFASLADMVAKAKGPRIRHVFVTNEVNASVSRHTGPLGFFGFGPVTLTLGLPLMQALTPPQLMSVIGHEYGHVAARDNAKGQWIYRIRNTWLRLGEQQQLERLWYALKLNRFYAWFIGVFSAHSFALSRQCEYEADAFASRVAGADHTAAALCAIAVHGQAIDTQYWHGIWQQAADSPAINSQSPYSSLHNWLAQERDHNNITDNVLRRQTDCTSTHPATLDRVRALGQPFMTPTPVVVSAANTLLGPLELELAARFDAEWMTEARLHWKHAHEQHLHSRQRYAELTARPRHALTRDELLELSALAHRSNDQAAVITSSQEILRREADNVEAQLTLAGLKLLAGNEAQLAVLRKLIQQQPKLLPDACGYAIDFFHKVQRVSEAAPWEEQLAAWEYERRAAAEERDLILASDTYAPHDLPPEIVNAITQHCANAKALDSVYLVRKEVRYLPEYPAYLVAYRYKHQMFRSQKKIQQDIEDFISNSGLDHAYRFVGIDDVAGLDAKLKKISGACIMSPKIRKQLH